MSEKIKTAPNEPISPFYGLVQLDLERSATKDFPGLSKREYFAAMAMQAFISNSDWNQSAAGRDHRFATVNYAVEYADELIRALNNIDFQDSLNK
jgi:hypothetical protein